MRLTGVLVACSLLALTACQSTTQPAVSSPSLAQSETGDKQQLVESHVVDGISACADFLQNGTTLALLETKGFKKSAFGNWTYNTGGLFGNSVTVYDVRGDECFVSYPGGISGVQKALNFATQTLASKGYSRETRTFENGKTATYFVKSGTSLEASASFKIVSGAGSISIRLAK